MSCQSINVKSSSLLYDENVHYNNVNGIFILPTVELINGYHAINGYGI